jgi:disulfide bond formation protein DsbB
MTVTLAAGVLSPAVYNTFGVLTLLSLVFAVVVFVWRLASPASFTDAAVRVGMVNALRLAWVIALVSTLGSLFYQFIVGLEPCMQCWLQRIAIFPLAIMLGIAVVKEDDAVVPYVWGLNVFGVVMSVWHMLVEFGVLAETSTCAASGPPCAIPYFKAFGFVTLAWMALATSLAVAACMLVVRVAARADDDADDTGDAAGATASDVTPSTTR